MNELYEANGYLLVPGVFDADEVEAMKDALGRILAAEAGDTNHSWSAVSDRQLVLKGHHDLQYHDAVFTRMVAHPKLVAVLTELIGPNVQLHHSKMLVKPPEQGAPFPMHQDYPYFPHERHTVLAASVHLDDTDEENGCLHVIPGSHRLGPLEAEGASHTVDYPLESGTPVPAAAGDVLFFNYLTVHGSGTNRSDRIRRNVLFQYRDPADVPVPNGDGKEDHVDWGMGLMVAGSNAGFFDWRPRFRIRQDELIAG
jgi:ectoine hydroxylase-related dioxygenase (phytanoyl-CoA dioxygenase family)